MKRSPPRDRSSYRHWTPITTRWHDNDVYGHVNNTIYYGWFDTAVNAWLVNSGLLDLDLGNPIGLVVETGCRYFAPVAFPQSVEVGLAVAKLGRSSVTYRLGIFAAGCPAAAAEGHFTHVHVDRVTRRPVELPDSWRALLAELQ